MQKCTTCQFYDRRQTSMTAGSVASAQQGHCRRMAPLLHPLTPKSYVIEGVWPTVRDDDWCGEWKVVARRSEMRAGDKSVASVLGGLPNSAHGARIAGDATTESIKVGVPGAAATAIARPFMPRTASPAQTAALMTTMVAGTTSGDD